MITELKPVAPVWTVRGFAYVADGYTELQGHLDKAITHLNQKLSLEELRSCDARAGEWKPVLGEIASGSEAPGTK